MRRPALFFATVMFLLLIGACIPVTPPTFRGTFYEDLARHYAPVIYQGAATDQDFITRVNFDGDWVGNNNWENQPTGDLSAYVYYSVIETETHWFIFYSLFHPRDYEPHPCEQGGCHENDLESIQLAVLKDGSTYGRLQAMETLAHNDIYLYPLDEAVGPGYLKVDGPLQVEDGRPVIFVETYGHGIRGRPVGMRKGTVIYRVGEQAERPSDINDEATYALRPIYDDLWQRRHQVGPGRLFDRPFFYGLDLIPAAFDGDNWGADKANTPWGYAQARDFKLHVGDWFLDPAKAMSFHATFPQPFSHRYLFNPYLADLRLLSASGESLRGKGARE